MKLFKQYYGRDVHGVMHVDGGVVFDGTVLPVEAWNDEIFEAAEAGVIKLEFEDQAELKWAIIKGFTKTEQGWQVQPYTAADRPAAH